LPPRRCGSLPGLLGNKNGSMAEQQPAKRRRGCLFYGCIGGLVLMLMLVVGLLIGLRYARKLINDFTDTQPMPLPTVQMSREQIDQLQQRIETFRTTVKASQPVDPLTLTSDEINALIATDPDLQVLKGKLYVTLENDQLKGQLSVPMESMGLHLFKGRYL